MEERTIFLKLVVAMLILKGFHGTLGLAPSLRINIFEGDVNTTYKRNVTKNDQVVFQYSLNHTHIDFETGEVRMEVEVLDADNVINAISEECPLLITLSQGKHVSSWDLPKLSNITVNRASIIHRFKNMAKTVCIDPTLVTANPTRTFQVVVVASTCNDQPINFNIRLQHTPTFLQIPIADEGQSGINTLVSPTAPRFFKFEFPPNVETVLIKLTSEDLMCMTISVQTPNCPVFDDESNVRFAGYWQTFTQKAGITIEKKDFNQGLYLILVTNARDEGCTHKDGYSYRTADSDNLRVSETKIDASRPRDKMVTVVINRVRSQNEYLWPTLLPLVIYFPILVVTFVIFVIFHRMSVRNYNESDDKFDTRCPLQSAQFICASHEQVDGLQRQRIENKSKRYLWLLVTVALFYCIPVFQLIINYLGIVYRTGEQDICYYNNLCSLPLDKIMDFNHIYSNVGYVIFGVAFILFAYVRHKKMDASNTTLFIKNEFGCWEGELIPNLKRHTEYGTFVHYGLFYSLGFALFMEGFLSAGYHICPNKSNFQFDTSFMYATAVLSYVKVYQFRHGFYMSELMAFFLLALVVGCVVLGLFSTNLGYTIFLSFTHLALVVIFQFYLLFIGRIPCGRNQDEPAKLEVIWGVTKELFGYCSAYNLPYLTRGHPNKSLFWWTFVWNILLVINSWTLVYGSNFATQVLYILLANLALYVMYYFIMKLIHGEFQGLLRWPCSPSVQPLLYGTISLLFWIPGMYYFMNPLSTWDVSPSESRLKNEECIVLQFYDNHDIWHLLSAPALFFSFMVFLTLDDALIGKHQKSIPVF